MGYIATKQGVPLVSYAHWLQALETDLRDRSRLGIERLRENPALRMLDFFRVMAPIAGSQRMDSGREAMDMPRIDVQHGLMLSPSLRNADQLGPQDVDGWLMYWERARAREVYGEFWDPATPQRSL